MKVLFFANITGCRWKQATIEVINSLSPDTVVLHIKDGQGYLRGVSGFSARSARHRGLQTEAVSDIKTAIQTADFVYLVGNRHLYFREDMQAIREQVTAAGKPFALPQAELFEELRAKYGTREPEREPRLPRIYMGLE
jgi:hypothetical protein